MTALRQAGMRITPQRAAICSLLASSKAHPTAAEIYHQLKPRFDSLSLATVYNTLQALTRVGAINVLGQAGDDAVHYDAETAPHINLACISCSRIIDLPSRHLDRLDQDVASASGYRLLGARLLYYGLCPDCQKEQHPARQETRLSSSGRAGQRAHRGPRPDGAE
jgi:Fur family peroxide stress response transcriptional regulator